MTKEVKILIVSALIFLSFFAYGKVKDEYSRITSRVEVTQAKVDSLADELQATTATIHAAIKSITDRFLAREGQEIGLENQASPVIAIPTIVMHSGETCGPCKAWIATRMPLYQQQGWKVQVLKETETNRRWPWYEITDADGSHFQVDGPLDNDKFQAAKRGK